MLMVIILTWGEDFVMKPVRSYQEVLELKRRLYRPGTDRDFIFFEAHYLCPVKMDNAVQQLAEDEQIEWLHTEVYPCLIQEGRMTKGRHGKIMKVITNGL